MTDLGLWVFLSTAGTEMDGVTMRRETAGHLAGKFSRESGGGKALWHQNVCLRH